MVISNHYIRLQLSPSKMKNVTLVIHHLVEQTLFAKNATALALVPVCPNILEIHIAAVGRNALQTTIATETKHVLIISAKIRVQEYVD